MDYSELLRRRIQQLIIQDFLSEEEGRIFQTLEQRMVDGPNGGEALDLLEQFHLSDDLYVRLLEKVLEGLIEIGEPGAKEKYADFLEEKGTMLPAVYLTPWEVTLRDLDSDNKVESPDALEIFYRE